MMMIVAVMHTDYWCMLHVNPSHLAMHAVNAYKSHQAGAYWAHLVMMIIATRNMLMHTDAYSSHLVLMMVMIMVMVMVMHIDAYWTLLEMMIIVTRNMLIRTDAYSSQQWCLRQGKCRLWLIYSNLINEEKDGFPLKTCAAIGTI